MSQTIKIDQLADTVMKGMEEYAKLAVDDLKADVQKAGKTVKQQIESTPDRGAFQEVSADASFGVWSCKTGRRKDKGFSAYRSCRTGGHRAADKGYREGFTEGRLVIWRSFFCCSLLLSGSLCLVC